jgi:acyl-CoA dehydrogenase
MRRRLTRDVFVPDASEAGLGQLEAALGLTVSARAAAEKLTAARRAGRLAAEPNADPIARALTLGIVDAGEAQLLRQASAAQDAAIEVDAFTAEEYRLL